MLLVLSLPAVSALAQSADQIAESVDRTGSFVGEGVTEPLTLDGLSSENPTFGYVALDATPSGGARSLAVDLLQRTSKSTVIVVTATEIGVESLDFDECSG